MFGLMLLLMKMMMMVMFIKIYLRINTMPWILNVGSRMDEWPD
jgi:hypothetical protein